jgi:hypothetical protein
MPNSNFKLIYYHINREGYYPFMQILLNNYISPFCLFGLNDQQFIFPTILYSNNNDIYNIVIQYLKEKLETIKCLIEDMEIKNINISGFHVYNQEIYIFIDISSIKLDRLFLNKTSQVWFSLITELVNTKKICDINISYEVTNFITNNINLFSKIDNCLYPSPEVIYIGDYFSKIEFQSIFGISKEEKVYGNYYYFSYSFEDAFHDGCWTKDGKPKYRFEKIITEENNGKYIEGGINRIALLLDKCKYIKEEEVNKLINLKEWEDFIEDYDCIFILLNNNKILILIKDFKRQYPLSYHKINKKSINMERKEII